MKAGTEVRLEVVSRLRRIRTDDPRFLWRRGVKEELERAMMTAMSDESKKPAMRIAIVQFREYDYSETMFVEYPATITVKSLSAWLNHGGGWSLFATLERVPIDFSEGDGKIIRPAEEPSMFADEHRSTALAVIAKLSEP